MLARARTAAEVRALVASMKAAGLNQLWLPVFFDGQDHTDLIAAALKAAKGTGIAVFPVLDLLAWGAGAPEDARDLTLLGETSAQSQERQWHLDALRSPEINRAPPPGPVYVSPFAPAASERLRGLVAKAAQPGVAGLVWRATTPPGYEPPPPGSGYVNNNQADLGYTAAARLAFLRKSHADPVDITLFQGRADTRLPEFDDYRASEDISKQWKQFRADADLALLRALRVRRPSARANRCACWSRRQATTTTPGTPPGTTRKAPCPRSETRGPATRSRPATVTPRRGASRAWPSS